MSVCNARAQVENAANPCLHKLKIWETKGGESPTFLYDGYGIEDQNNNPGAAKNLGINIKDVWHDKTRHAIAESSKRIEKKVKFAPEVPSVKGRSRTCDLWVAKGQMVPDPKIHMDSTKTSEFWI